MSLLAQTILSGQSPTASSVSIFGQEHRSTINLQPLTVALILTMVALNKEAAHALHEADLGADGVNEGAPSGRTKYSEPSYPFG